LRFVITVFCLLFLALVPATPGAAQTLTSAPLVSLRTAPAPEPGGVGVQLLDIPTATQNDPRARVYIVDRLAPGVEIQRRIQVQNNSNSVQSVRIYPGAATIEDGNFVGGNDPAVNELTTWTAVDQPQLELLAGEAVEVMVTITVPQDAPESEQYAVVWAEVRSAPAEGTNIVQASRVGIRIYLSVGPGNGAPADFSITSLTTARDVHGNPTRGTSHTLDCSRCRSLSDRRRAAVVVTPTAHDHKQALLTHPWAISGREARVCDLPVPFTGGCSAGCWSQPAIIVAADPTALCRI